MAETRMIIDESTMKGIYFRYECLRSVPHVEWSKLGFGKTVRLL